MFVANVIFIGLSPTSREPGFGNLIWSSNFNVAIVRSTITIYVPNLYISQTWVAKSASYRLINNTNFFLENNHMVSNLHELVSVANALWKFELFEGLCRPFAKAIRDVENVFVTDDYFRCSEHVKMVGLRDVKSLVLFLFLATTSIRGHPITWLAYRANGILGCDQVWLAS